MPLKEFLWGTPEEIQADQRYAVLKSRSRLSAAQKGEFNRLRGLSKRLFLRRMATVIGGSILVTSAVGAYVISRPNQVEQSSKKYNGPIDAFKGLEYVSENSLLEMVNTLEDTRHPFLDKIAQGLKILHSVPIRPQEFPEWIDEESFPFVFVQDSTDTFTTQFQISKSSGDNVKFVVPEKGATEPQEGIDSLFVGIKLGLRNISLKGDLLQPAILLAKEYLTLLHGIVLNEEFYDMTIRLFPDVSILDPLGREITDRSKQKAIGRRLLHNNLTDSTNINWKIADGFSILLLGPVLKDLVVAGTIKNYRNISSIVLAANLVTDNSVEFQRDLVNFIQSWCLKDGFTFPDGTGAKSFSEPYYSAIIRLENQIDLLLGNSMNLGFGEVIF